MGLMTMFRKRSQVWKSLGFTSVRGTKKIISCPIPRTRRLGLGWQTACLPLTWHLRRGTWKITFLFHRCHVSGRESTCQAALPAARCAPHLASPPASRPPGDRTPRSLSRNENPTTGPRHMRAPEGWGGKKVIDYFWFQARASEAQPGPARLDHQLEAGNQEARRQELLGMAEMGQEGLT